MGKKSKTKVFNEAIDKIEADLKDAKARLKEGLLKNIGS